MLVFPIMLFPLPPDKMKIKCRFQKAYRRAVDHEEEALSLDSVQGTRRGDHTILTRCPLFPSDHQVSNFHVVS
jgi:hypothetical protein